MDGKGFRWCRIVIRGLFLVGVALVLIASLPQMLLHLKPTYDPGRQVPIETIAGKHTLTDDDYQLLLEQTGLGKCAVEELRQATDYQEQDILRFQKARFCERPLQCRQTGLLTRQDCAEDAAGKQIPMVPVQDGDILVSFSSHTFGWRHGHAGLVIDADKGLCLEAIVIGCDSELENLNHWKSYSNFAILRLKASAKTRAQIADFASQNLCGVPYGLTSGLFGKKVQPLSKTLTAQCAYLIWYAFIQFGYDLDSDGGKAVTVKNLSESDDLELVQVYGMNSLKIKHKMK